MLEDVDQQQHVQGVLKWWGLCAGVDVVRTCGLMRFLKPHRGLGHCRFQKKELVEENNTEIICKKHDEKWHKVVNHLNLWDESVSKMNRSTAQTAIVWNSQRSDRGNGLVNTEQTDWSWQETSNAHCRLTVRNLHYYPRWHVVSRHLSTCTGVRFVMEMECFLEQNQRLSGKSRALLGASRISKCDHIYIQHEYV